MLRALSAKRAQRRRTTRHLTSRNQPRNATHISVKRTIEWGDLCRKRALILYASRTKAVCWRAVCWRARSAKRARGHASHLTSQNQLWMANHTWYVYIHIYVYICMYIHIFIHVYGIYTYIYIYVCIYTYMYSYIYIVIFVYFVCRPHTYIHRTRHLTFQNYL